MTRVLWMAAQAAAIGGLTWMFTTAPRPDPIDPGGAIFLSVILVAFGTAVIVNVFDWVRRLGGQRPRSQPHPAPTDHLARLSGSQGISVLGSKRASGP